MTALPSCEADRGDGSEVPTFAFAKSKQARPGHDSACPMTWKAAACDFDAPGRLMIFLARGSSQVEQCATNVSLFSPATGSADETPGAVCHRHYHS